MASRMPASGTVLETATNLVAAAGLAAGFRAVSMRASMSARFSAMVMTANLAIHQARLNQSLPLVLMTDERKADWAAAVRALPPASMVVVRARDRARRRTLAEELYGLARLLIANDPNLAEEVGAAGLHLPEARMREAGHWRVRHP